MKKNWDIITVLVCLALCTLIGAFTLALPKKSFSAEENRALARQPVISARTFLQGKYFKESFPTPGDLLNPGIEPNLPASLALAGRFFTTAPPGKPVSFSV